MSKYQYRIQRKEDDTRMATITTRADGTRIEFRIPKMTDLERFVWEHPDVPAAVLASQLNRSEQAISAAYSRALAKDNERIAIERIQNI